MGEKCSTKSERRYERERKALGPDNREDYDILLQSEYQDGEDIENAIAVLQSRHLIRIARRYRIAFPSSEDWIDPNHEYHRRHLRPEAVGRLRDAIRAEKKAHWEDRTRWLSVGPLIGLVGAKH